MSGSYSAIATRFDFRENLIARMRVSKSRRVSPRCLSVLLLSSLVFSPGCEPPPLTDTGVVGVFGGLGLGPGSFHYPRAITAEADGSIFVVDKSGRIQRFAADGTYETAWHMPDTSAGFPVGLSQHPDGRIFVADTHCHRVMVFARDGTELGSFGKLGTAPGAFLLPTDVAFDARGNIYVSEYGGNDRISVWSAEFECLGVLGAEPIAGRRLSRPSGIGIDAEQTLWIADACNHRLVRMSLDGRVLGVFGEFGDEPGQLRYPYDLCITSNQTILVCEYEGHRLQWFSKEGRSLRTWGRSGRELGTLFAPWGATVGPQNRIYVVDSLNNRIQIIEP